MPIRVSVPGRGFAEFPDGTTYDQAFASIQEEVPDFQPSREDVFASMKQKSDGMASADNARFLGDTGAVQGFLEQTAGKTAAGFGSIAAAGGRVLDMPLDSYYKSEEKAGRPVNRIEAKFRNPFQEAADQTASVDTTGPTSRFLSDVAGGVLPSAIAGLATGGIGAPLIAGTQQFGDTRKRVLDYYKSLNLPEYEAQNTADQLGVLSGAITAAATKYTPEILSKIPGIGKYLGEQGAEGLAKKLLIDRLKQGSVGEIAKRIVGNAAGEATEEGVNQFLLEVVESKQLEPNLSWAEIAKRTGMAAAQGAVGGGAVSTIGEGVRKGMDVAVEAAYPGATERTVQRLNEDVAREQAANQLAEMFGLPPIHAAPEEKLKAIAPVAQPRPSGITQEAQLLRQADAAFRGGQISQPEYQVAVDRFEQARKLDRSQQPVTTDALPIQVAAPSVPGQERSQVGLSQMGQGNQEPQIAAGTQAQGPVQNEAQAPVVEPQLSTADRIYNKLDEIDKGLGQNVYSSFFGEVAIAKLVLKTAKLAIRAGQSVAEAVRGAIAKAKQQYPDSKFDTAAFEKSILADLQPLLSGQEEQSVIAQAAEPFVKANETAAAQLDQTAFTGVQLGKARQDLRDARDQVVQLALAQGIPVSDIPSEHSGNLAEVAASLGGDAASIQDLQARINHEERARELHSLTKQQAELSTAEARLLQASPGKYADVLAYLAESKRKLAKKAASEKFNDVRDRASEIALQEAEKLSNTAKRDALQNGHVVEAIMGPVEEMRKLIEETPELEGRTAEEMLADPLVSDDTKQLFVIRMSNAFRAFDQSRENLESDLISSEQSLQMAIDRLEGKLKDARMDKAFADIVISDAGRALRGETGLTGGLNPKWVEWCDSNQSALRSFARSLATATGQNAITAQKLIDWIRFGVDASAMPDVRNTAAHNWGVGDEVLNEIKAILIESRATRNAVALIYSSGNQKLAAHDLRKIATAAAGGDETLANSLFDKLMSKTESERSKLSALSRELASELEKKRLELETLKEAKLLFDRVATSPTFTDGRNAIEGSQSSFMQQFLLRKNDQMALAGFSLQDGSEQPSIGVIGSQSGAPDFSVEAGNEILKWRDNALAYVTQYEVAQSDFENGAGPNPVQLGLDPAVYRGLKYTLTYEMPGILDGTLFHPEAGVDYSGSNMLLQTWQWFRQIDATAKLVKGIFGNNMRQAIADFRDVKMMLATVASDASFNEIPKLLSAAMASHPSVGGKSFLDRLGPVGKNLQKRFAVNGNVEKYRQLVFNPMANIGRGFGTLRVGAVLPSGEVVTQADIDLLKRAQERDRALLKIAQRRGKGQSQQYGGREFRREAGSVGDFGTPRKISDSGEKFINALAAAAKKLGRDSVFTWEQLQSGDHPVLRAWRSAASNYFALNLHVHDSAYRTDRDVQVHPFMRQAYRSLAEDLEAGGYLAKIDTVGDLAERLVQHFPADTGFDPRTFVLEQLNDEFSQYNRNAIDYAGNIAAVSGEPLDNILIGGISAARAKSSAIIETETSNNEFTKPAGTLKIPSAFYDYSSISPLEMSLSSSRAIGERTVDMKNAIRAAIQNVSATLETLKSNDEAAREKIAKSLNLSISESIAYLENLSDMLRGVDDSLGRNYKKDNAVVSGVKSGLSLMVGGALTSVGAAATNILSASASALYLHGMINRAGAATLALTVSKYAAKLPRNLIYSAINGVSEVTANDFKKAFDYLDKHAKPLARSLDQIANGLRLKSALGLLSDYSGYAQFVSSIEEARRLGFSQQRGLFTQVGNAIRESVQYVDKLEEEQSQSGLKKAGRAAALLVRIPTRVVSEALKFTAMELGDLAINSTTVSAMSSMDESLKDLAIKWASDRISKGMGFDPSNPEFLVRPDEYRKHGALGRLTSEDNLAHMRALIQMAGSNLEQMLWDYYKASEGGSKNIPVFGQFEDSMRRVIIGAINASTFTNRPIKAQTDTDIGVVQALTGFSTNMAIGILTAMKGSQRNVKTALNRTKRLFEALGKIIAGFLAFMLIGSYSTGISEWLNRTIAGKIARKMLPIDKEFWNLDAKLPWRLVKTALAIAPFLGAIGRIDEGIRPDVSGGIFAISAMNMVANYVVGAIKLPAEDLPWLAKGMMRRIFPITQVAPLGDENGPNSPATKLSAGIASFAAATDAAGLTKPNLQGPASGMAPINEKTGMLSKLAEAGMAASIAERKGDAEGLAEANAEIDHQKQRLIDYHRKQITEDNERRGITSSDFQVEKDAIAAARRDWSGMNPIARVLGHQPTQSEMDRINAQLSGDRRAAADLAWDSFSRMSDRFPTAKGATPVAEMVKRPKGGGGSRFGYSAPVALAVRGGTSRGRRVSLRGSRTRLRGRTGLRSKRRGLRLRRR